MVIFCVPHVIFDNIYSGPDAGRGGWVKRGWWKKQFVFGRNPLQIAIFWYLIVLASYPLQKNM
jgi:hypothetical protein